MSTETSYSVTAFTTTVTTSTQRPTATFCEAEVRFGDGQTPSAILIPADTVAWVPMVFDTNASSYQGNSMLADVVLFLYADYTGLNLTVGIYGPNGSLISPNDPLQEPSNFCQAPCNLSATPNGTANQIVSLPNWQHMAEGEFPVLATNLTLAQGSTFYVALVATHAIWAGGFSPSDREGGSGLQYGQSPWEAPVTYEGAVGQQTDAALPSSLPQAEFSSSFETSIYGYAGFTAGQG
jgi:hypothetical protein